jgi:hypothetical protein
MGSSGKRQGWVELLEKLAELAQLDRQCLAFGASGHRYQFGPRVAEKSVVQRERELGVELPLELRTFYLTVGDGGAGPNYGLLPCAQVARIEDRRPRSQRILLAIAEEGCGHRTCLNAANGRVVHVSADGEAGAGAYSLLEHYAKWLESELAAFKAVEDAMRSAMTYEQMQAKWVGVGVGDMIASIANVERPASLFGTETVRIYQGHTQFPWYRQVLAEWRQANGVAGPPEPLQLPTQVRPVRVAHSRFGEGLVLSRQGHGHDAVVEVRFSDAVRKIKERFLVPTS